MVLIDPLATYTLLRNELPDVVEIANETEVRVLRLPSPIPDKITLDFSCFRSRLLVIFDVIGVTWIPGSSRQSI